MTVASVGLQPEHVEVVRIPDPDRSRFESKVIVRAGRTFQLGLHEQVCRPRMARSFDLSCVLGSWDPLRRSHHQTSKDSRPSNDSIISAILASSVHHVAQSQHYQP